MSDTNDAVLRITDSDAGFGIIARKRVRAITGGRLPTVEDYHAALVQCLRDKAAEIERRRLTDAERKAVERAAETLRYLQADYGKTQTEQDAAIMRGLLERLG